MNEYINKKETKKAFIDIKVIMNEYINKKRNKESLKNI